MAYILDSHVMVWQLEDPSRFPARVVRLLENDRNRIFVSPVSAYELRYKASCGRLPALPDSFGALAEAAGYEELPLTAAAAEIAGRLPVEHRDPFDRLLAGQAIAHGCSIVTFDKEIARLGVQTFW